MYLNCKTQVFINDILLQSIVSVDIHNDGNHIGATCEIVVPLNARIGYSGKLMLPTRVLFNTGDHIVIKAKYEGYESYGDSDGWLQIFEGFLYDFYETTPIKIKCLDYIYWFNMGIYGSSYVTTKKLTKLGKIKKGSIKGGEGKYFKSIEFADLLQDIIDWTNNNIESYNNENGNSFPEVTLIRPEFSFILENITFSNMSAAAVLEWLKRELGFNISLTGTQLYANVASFTTGEIKLSTDINVIESSLQSTNLTKRHSRQSKGANSIFLRIKLKVYFEKEDGTKDSIELGDPNGQLRECFFYKVAKGNMIEYPQGSGQLVPENYLKFGNEALNQCYLKRYTGEVETYLYPDCDLFWKVTYNDIRYPERNGDYVITKQQITINDKGYHRKLRLAFLTNYNIIQQANAG
jgi:hypothetical protein